MQLPLGWPSASDSRVVRLLKSIYGLKQSGALWNQWLHTILGEIGFKRTPDDPCVYVHPSHRTIIVVYVDDMVITGPSEQHIQQIEQHLASSLTKIKASNIEKFTGIDVTRDRRARTITLSQAPYIADLVRNEGMEQSTVKGTPGTATRNLYVAEHGDGTDHFMGLAGSIRYLADHTCPESLFMASQMSSCCATPGPSHRKAAD